MANHKKPKKAHDHAGSASNMGNSPQANGPRQRNVPATPNGSSTPPRIKHINPLEGVQTGRWSLAKMIGVGAAWLHMTVPPYINWGIMMGLIFGGCCSNVRISPEQDGRRKGREYF